MTKIKLREVKESDIGIIYVWRNSPEVRKMMSNDSEISLEEHKNFWDKKLKTKEDFSFIVEYSNIPVGVMRLDKRKICGRDCYEVDILVNPEYQKKGIGTMALGKLMRFVEKKGLKNIFAKVKKENYSSQKIFEKNNFKLSYLYYEYAGGNKND